jgi:DNA invertase Pin-like site-specific DNA recombinase
MRIGIYTRKNNEILPSIKWLDDNGFDAFEIYNDDILTEYGDISEREGLNMLFYDAEMSHLDAVYVDDLKVISAVTIKILQVLLEVQKLNLPLYFKNGCIKPDDQMIKHFHDQIIQEWDKIQNESKNIDLFDQKSTQL